MKPTIPTPSQAAPALDTVAVRGGEPTAHGYQSVTVPIVCTATYAFENSQAIHDHFQGRVAQGEYGRYGNPTVDAAECKLAALEGAPAALLFPSGMSAITTLLLTMLKPGDHVVMTSDSYRRTRQFLRTTMAKFGVEHSLVASDDYAGLEAAIRPGKTRLLISEAPTNPNLRVVDVARLAAICEPHRGLKLLVDTTLATPVNFRPLESGAHLVLHSCSKYLAGHNDVLSGGICGSQALIDALREARGTMGPMPDPHGAYLLMRGMKTLGVRVRQHNSSALRVARFLEAHPRVQKVLYPGLASHPDHEAASRQFTGFGGMVSFFVDGDLEHTSRFVDGCRLCTIAPSMGGVESLIEQPALMSFYELSPEERMAVGIAPNLVRLSVGLEDAGDLMGDLDRALHGAVG